MSDGWLGIATRVRPGAKGHPSSQGRLAVKMDCRVNPRLKSGTATTLAV